MRILLVPLDDRPVTYTYPQLIMKSARVEPVLPPRSLLGSLNRPAQIDELLSFCENIIQKNTPDAVILCLDSLLYGGLITSRRTDEDLKIINERLERIKKWRQLGQSAKPQIKFYAQSSIMRISDNYDNTEEKDYWKTYGRELFEWSGCLHRLAKREKLTPGLLESLERKIPEAIRKDYFDTRLRNFTINQFVLRAMDRSKGTPFLDYLVFSQDDSGTWGLNVSEKERLEAECAALKLDERVTAYAGADEVACTLISRALIDYAVQTETATRRPLLSVRFSPKETCSIASRYEGQEIGATVKAQVKACGVDFVIEDNDANGAESKNTGKQPSFTLIVHGPRERQGDHITLPGLPDLSQLDTRAAVEATLKAIKETESDVILADVAYANGGDPLLVEELLKAPDMMTKIKSYAGWNTTGNTMGSALALAVAYWFYRENENQEHSPSAPNKLTEHQKQCLFTRFLDDWAYQARVRRNLDGDPSTQRLAEQISPFIKSISQAVSIEPAVRLSFPWRRTFEIEIGFEGS
ncbi:MAG: DUF4127 family protein [Candidatus Melainabacteria bacterium]|jgi:hypothetical protein|nr:DUF4127 family protein [Candidatus Melainabacteria bacterium]